MFHYRASYSASWRLQNRWPEKKKSSAVPSDLIWTFCDRPLGNEGIGVAVKWWEPMLNMVQHIWLNSIAEIEIVWRSVESTPDAAAADDAPGLCCSPVVVTSHAVRWLIKLNINSITAGRDRWLRGKLQQPAPAAIARDVAFAFSGNVYPRTGLFGPSSTAAQRSTLGAFHSVRGYQVPVADRSGTKSRADYHYRLPPPIRIARMERF